MGADATLTLGAALTFDFRGVSPPRRPTLRVPHHTTGDGTELTAEALLAGIVDRVQMISLPREPTSNRERSTALTGTQTARKDHLLRARFCSSPPPRHAQTITPPGTCGQPPPLLQSCPAESPSAECSNLRKGR
jgi:hypothetical protein